jgi:DNA-binding transcriptional regulator GbsR (MarR family)
MVREVWVRGSSGRRKYYEAETDFWQIITNILKGREMRDVERALVVMQENVRQLNEAMPEMNEEDRQVAELFLGRIHQMQALFEFAQLTINTILSRVNDVDVQDISAIEIK